jgi:hypothetical protein
MKSIQLIHCNNYHYWPRKETYVGGKVYVMNDDDADLLLGREDDQGYPYFEEVVEKKPANKPKRGRAKAKAKPADDAEDEDESTDGAVSL